MAVDVLFENRDVVAGGLTCRRVACSFGARTSAAFGQSQIGDPPIAGKQVGEGAFSLVGKTVRGILDGPNSRMTSGFGKGRDWSC